MCVRIINTYIIQIYLYIYIHNYIYVTNPLMVAPNQKKKKIQCFWGSSTADTYLYIYIYTYLKQFCVLVGGSWVILTIYNYPVSSLQPVTSQIRPSSWSWWGSAKSPSPEAKLRLRCAGHTRTHTHIYIYIICTDKMVEGSSEVKLSTMWPMEKQRLEESD